MAKETSAPNATILDTTKKTALSTNARTVTSCDPDMMKTDVLTTPNTLAKIPSNKNLHLHPPYKSPHQKPLKNCTSHPTDRAVTPHHHPTELGKEDAKERTLNGRSSKTMSTEAFPNNSGKWMKNTTKNSRTSLSLLTTKSNMTTLHMTTSMESQVTLKISKFSNGISNVTRG